MGWTHHWQRDTELRAERFALAVTDCSRLLGQLGIAIAGRDGTGTPVLQQDAVVFNGAVPAAVEPFEIHQTEFDRHGRQKVRSYCKTQHAPYDLCVQVALIVFKKHLGDQLQVTSDGTDEDWQKARTSCDQLLGYGSDFRLDAD